MPGAVRPGQRRAGWIPTELSDAPVHRASAVVALARPGASRLLAAVAHGVGRDTAFVGAREGLAGPLSLAAGPPLTLRLATLALPLSLSLLTLGPLALSLALPLSLALSLTLLPTLRALTLALALPRSLALAAGTALGLSGPHLARTAFAGATALEARATAGAAGAWPEARTAGSRTEAGAAREGAPSVQLAQALAAQHLQAALAAQFRSDQHAADDAAHHGLAGIAVLGETRARGRE